LFVKEKRKKPAVAKQQNIASQNKLKNGVFSSFF